METQIKGAELNFSILNHGQPLPVTDVSGLCSGDGHYEGVDRKFFKDG